MVSNDSIEFYIEHAQYSKALLKIQKLRNINTENELNLDLLELKVMIDLGKVTEGRLIYQRLKNKKNQISENISLYLRFVLLENLLLNHEGKAESAFHQLLDAIHSHMNKDVRFPNEMAEIYGELGKYYLSESKYKLSKDYFVRALNLIKQENNPHKSLLYYTYLAELYWNINLKDSSRIAFDKARLQLKNIRYSNPDIMESYMRLIYYCDDIKIDSELEEWLLSQYYIKLQENYPKDHYMYGYYYHLKGISAYERKDFEHALHCVQQSERFTQMYPVLGGIRTQNLSLMVALLYTHKRNYTQAIYFCHQAIQLFHNKSNTYFYYIIGLSNQKLNNYESADNAFSKIIDNSAYYTSLPDITNCGYTYYELGKTALNKSNFDKAEEYLNAGLRFYYKIPNRNDLGSIIHISLAKLYYYKKDVETALKHFQMSIILGCQTFTNKDIFANPAVEDVLFKIPLVETFFAKAYIFYTLYERDSSDLGLLKKSLECQEIAVKLHERNMLNTNEENSGLNMANLKAKELNNAVSYAALLYLKTNDEEYAEKAFQYAEKSKMQLLLIRNLKNQAMHLVGLPDSLIEKEEKIKNTIVFMEKSLSGIPAINQTSAAYETGLEKLSLLYNERDLLIHNFKKDYPKYYQAKYNFEVSGIKKIQQLLDDDQVMIEYQLLLTELITFVISKHEFSIRYQFLDKKFHQEISKLRSIISQNPLYGESGSVLSEFVSTSEHLYSILIEPVYEKIKNKRLIIVPHNALTQIPFEVLIKREEGKAKQTGFRNLNYLIREFSIIYAYSGNLLLENENAKKKNGKGTGIFLSGMNAGSAFGDSIKFPELKGAGSEVRRVKRLSHGRVFREQKTTKNAFLSNASKFSVLHIASHTVLDGVNPFLSCILLTPEDSSEQGLLYAWEISQMKLNAKLVVLSGCNTGYGVLKKNEGLISLARSFFYAGVKTIAFTLWPAADKAGSEICSGFYKEIKKRHTLDVAMQSAKLNFIDNADPVNSHPYFWANYIIVGKDDNITLRKYPLWSEIALGLIALVILGWAYRQIIN